MNFWIASRPTSVSPLGERGSVLGEARGSASRYALCQGLPTVISTLRLS